MLKSLVVKNFALIEELNIDFNEGFTAITGETGAGKSILLGAFALILGERADVGMLLDSAKKCIVEGVFDVSNYDLKSFFEEHDIDYYDKLVLRREITTDGRSRAFVNDSPSTLTVIRQLGEFLVDIHSQNKTTSLNNMDYQLELIDNFACISDKVRAYREVYTDYKRLLELLSELKRSEQESIKDRDYLQFQYDELEKACLKPNEKESLENELNILSNAEEIRNGLQLSMSIIDDGDTALIAGLQNIRRCLKDLVKIYGDGLSHLYERVEGMCIDLKDIASDLSSLYDKTSFDPLRATEVSERLDVINRLEQKHQVTGCDELLRLIDTIGEKLSSISSIADDISEVEKEVAAKFNILLEMSSELTSIRLQAICNIEDELTAVISKLGMVDAIFKIEHFNTESFTPAGKDKVVFKFNANKGRDLKEISKIASGGELSRLMLAVKSITGRKRKLPTIVFDEIDTGVSGDIASKMGDIMLQMSDNMQVIAITHLPQVASKAKTHLHVYKDNKDNKVVSKIICLTEKQRIDEIAKMLSGENVTSAAVANAKELITDKKG